MGEYDACQAFREKKSHVLHSNSSKDTLLDETLLSAICIYSFNDPKYHTIMLRVRH